MINQATQHLISTVRDSSSRDADMQVAAQSLLDSAGRVTATEANAALLELARHISIDDLSRAAFLALVCGALVENGCDPAALRQPLIERLKSLLESSARLAGSCVAQIPTPKDENDDPIE